MKKSATLLRMLIGTSLFFFIGACANTQTQSIENEIAVKGKVEVIGSSVAKGYMLKTDDRNSYLLDLSDEMAKEINAVYPKVVVVQGRLYLGDWVGEKQACLEVISWKVAV